MPEILELSIAAPAMQLSDMIVGSDGAKPGLFRGRGGAEGFRNCGGGGFRNCKGSVFWGACCWIIFSVVVLLAILVNEDADERREFASHGSEKSNSSSIESIEEVLLCADDDDPDRFNSRLAGSKCSGGERGGVGAQCFMVSYNRFL